MTVVLLLKYNIHLILYFAIDFIKIALQNSFSFFFPQIKRSETQSQTQTTQSSPKPTLLTFIVASSHKALETFELHRFESIQIYICFCLIFIQTQALSLSSTLFVFVLVANPSLCSNSSPEPLHSRYYIPTMKQIISNRERS